MSPIIWRGHILLHTAIGIELCYNESEDTSRYTTIAFCPERITTRGKDEIAMLSDSSQPATECHKRGLDDEIRALTHVEQW